MMRVIERKNHTPAYGGLYGWGETDKHKLLHRVISTLINVGIHGRVGSKEKKD